MSCGTHRSVLLLLTCTLIIPQADCHLHAGAPVSGWEAACTRRLFRGLQHLQSVVIVARHADALFLVICDVESSANPSLTAVLRMSTFALLEGLRKILICNSLAATAARKTHCPAVPSSLNQKLRLVPAARLALWRTRACDATCSTLMLQAV